MAAQEDERGTNMKKNQDLFPWEMIVRDDKLVGRSW